MFGSKALRVEVITRSVIYLHRSWFGSYYIQFGASLMLSLRASTMLGYGAYSMLDSRVS